MKNSFYFLRFITVSILRILFLTKTDIVAHYNLKVLYLTFIVFFFAFANSNVFAQEDIQADTLKIHPSFAERIMVHDNIYQVSGKGGEDKESDIINIYTPGLYLELPFGGAFKPAKGHLLLFDWYSDFKNYRDNADQNQQNHYIDSSLTLNFPRGLDIILEERYEDTNTPAGSETDQLHPRKTNLAGITVSLPNYFRRFDIELQYENFDQSYDENALERANRNESRFSFRIPFNPSPRITMFPEYTYGITNYDKSSIEDALSDSHFNEIFGGIEWLATARTTGIVKLGYRNRQYNRASVSNVNTFVMSAEVNVYISKHTWLKVDLIRKQRESEFTLGSNSHITSGGGVTISHMLTNKLTAELNAQYHKANFKGVSRKDDIYDFAATIDYTFNNWLSADINYTYREKDVSKDFELESDRINRASVGIMFNF